MNAFTAVLLFWSLCFVVVYAIDGDGINEVADKEADDDLSPSVMRKVSAVIFFIMAPWALGVLVYMGCRRLKVNIECWHIKRIARRRTRKILKTIHWGYPIPEIDPIKRECTLTFKDVDSKKPAQE